jgi:hypothetical protein
VLGELKVKINEVITESVRSKFGTPIGKMASQLGNAAWSGTKALAKSLAPQEVKQAFKQQQWQQGGKEDWENRRKEYYDLLKRNQQQSEPVADIRAPSKPEVAALEKDILNTLPDGMQFRFEHPADTSIEVIIRPEGYFYTQLPKDLRGTNRVRRDPRTGLYPVLRPSNIRQINNWYDDAAEKNLVREEPVEAL